MQTERLLEENARDMMISEAEQHNIRLLLDSIHHL